MARPLRIVFPGAWYHVTNRGLARRPIFRTAADGARFLDLLARVSARFDFEVHAFCLMSNHYHLLVRTPLANLSEAMRYLDGVYTQRFNRSHGRDGPLFRGRFACVLVQADRHLVCAARYIHLNPVEARLVDRPEDWSRSSYRAYLDPRLAPAWLHTRVILAWFGRTGGRERHRAFVEQGIDASTASFFARSRRPPVLGSATYRAGLSAVLDEVASVEPAEMPEIERLALRPDLDAITRCALEVFGVQAERLPARQGRSTRLAALARGAIVDLAVRAGHHPLKRVSAWLGYARATSAANAARRFRAACDASPDVRARFHEAVSRLRRAEACRPEPSPVPRKGDSDEDLPPLM